MGNTNQSSEVKTKNITLKLVIAWIFGSLVGLGGIISLFSDPLLGIFLILSAIIVFPPTYSFIKDKLRISLSTGLKVTIVVILLGVGGALSAKEHPSSNINPPVSIPAQAEASPQPVQTQASVPAAPPVTPQILLNINGSGTKTTQIFTAGGEWTLNYSYDCSDFGSKGNFAVEIYDSSGSMSFQNAGIDQLGKSGSDTEYYHSGGSYYLQVISECNWKIQVKG